jgi:HTH-type transcriptional regulator/antitoxin HigA
MKAKKTLANPVKMIELGAPRLIHSDVELERYTNTLFELTALPKPTLAEIETINLLGLLVETYESQRFTIEPSSPVEVLRFLMERNGLQQRDLVAELGRESNISLILSGKRNLTIPHIQKLSRKFGVPASLFVESLAQVA